MITYTPANLKAFQSARAADQFPTPGPADSWVEVVRNISGGVTVMTYEYDVERSRAADSARYTVTQVAMSCWDARRLALRLMAQAEEVDAAGDVVRPLAATRIDDPRWSDVLSCRTNNALINAYGKYEDKPTGRGCRLVAPLAIDIAREPDVKLLQVKNFGVKGLEQVRAMRARLMRERLPGPTACRFASVAVVDDPIAQEHPQAGAL